MARALSNPDLLSLGAGFTDNETLPVALVKRITEELLSSPEAATYLQYGTNQGRPALRRAVCDFLAIHPGEAPDHSPESVYITNGSQQALYLAMQSLCNPGDLVLVERPTYFVFMTILQGLQIEPVGIPTKPDGSFDLPALEALLARLKSEGKLSRLKAAYLVSYFSNPSSRSLGKAEKTGLAEVLARHHPAIAVIEDAAYRELFFHEPHPVPSILSLPAFADFPCLYLGTFTKPFATGLKVGYGICNQPEWKNKMLWAKGYQDFGTSNFNQAIIEKVILDGHYPQHLQRLRQGYRTKAIAFGEALQRYQFEDMGFRTKRPGGGLYYWVEGPEDLDTRAGQPFCEACLEAGVLYVPGDLCYPAPAPRNLMRLSFGSLPEEKLDAAVARLASVIQTFTSASVSA
jgi:2-aminoadipate transaminase